MSQPLEETVKDLEDVLKELKNNSSEEKAQMRFCGVTHAVCYSALTTINFSPKNFNKKIALKIKRLFENGLEILDKSKADLRLINYAKKRYEILEPYLKKYEIYKSDY